PRYAILSHTWTASELTFQDLTTAFQDLPTPGPAPAAHPGYPKLRAACALAAREGFEYIWIDTVCIDKTSSAELSEAINSMFAWYQGAAVCYAFLADVGAGGGGTLAGSRWFTRGWTLQELIAPAVVVFLDGAWREVGTKSSLVGELAAITGVDEGVLVPRGVLDACSVAQRMSWAAGRTTTRVEDGAYSLMGLFDVNMPLLYGEGEKAFLRLQREIMQQSDDMSIFVWKYPGRAGYVHRSGLLAPAPSCFEG
ncbi:heterokaryon incompatibility protein-domain-containing protein, partial [Lasiosphaeris hirsuta]